ncbi:hypothetical protein ACFXDE_43355, partial [Kitasatospora sp. NPDC059408]
AKMDGHVLYEKERLPGLTPHELDVIKAEQADVFGKVHVPDGAADIKLPTEPVHDIPTGTTHEPHGTGHNPGTEHPKPDGDHTPNGTDHTPGDHTPGDHTGGGDHTPGDHTGGGDHTPGDHTGTGDHTGDSDHPTTGGHDGDQQPPAAGEAAPNTPPTELTPQEKIAIEQRLKELEERFPDDFSELEKDPDKSWKVNPGSSDEARVGLDLREQGKLPPDMQRPPERGLGEFYVPSNGEYYDIKGVHSDWPPLNNQRDRSKPFGGAYNPAHNEKFVEKLDDQIVEKGRIVILDMRNANQAAIDDLKAVIEQKGWGDRVIWYP